MSGGFDFDELDRMFFAECDECLRSAEAALGLTGPGAADPEGLEAIGRCAHSLKGASLTLGFTGLGALASALDQYVVRSREAGTGPDWALLREGFAAIRANLANLRDGAAKSEGAPQELLDRLEAAGEAGSLPCWTVVFRLSATGSASPVLFEDMLADLRELAAVKVLQSPWDTSGRVCRLECCSALAEKVLIEIIERVAEPGSVTCELSTGQSVATEEGGALFELSANGRRTDEVDGSSPLACVSFSVGSRRFAADAHGVEEVRCGDPMHPSISGSALVCGELEVDGIFVPVIDLHQCLGLGAGRVRASSMQLISQLAGEAVAVLVDDVEDVLTISPQAIQPVADALARDLPGGVRGLVKLNGDLLWLIDLPGLLEACFRRRDAR